MRSDISFILTDNAKDISSELLDNNSRIKLFDSAYYKKYSWEEFRIFCHIHARYGIPTTELVNFIKEIIDDRSCIEIGSGHGDLGFHLGIKMTDNKQQEFPQVKIEYELMKQPTIKYPKDVEEIDALDAVIKYKPKVVVASWITTYAPREMPYGSNPYGVKEDKILDLVETLIIIGNDDVHSDKPILRYTHKKFYSPWIISRAKNKHKNVIYIWSK
jgi:hypothetical protein